MVRYMVKQMVNFPYKLDRNGIKREPGGISKIKKPRDPFWTGVFFRNSIIDQIGKKKNFNYGIDSTKADCPDL